jgi:hypothetical protein
MENLISDMENEKINILVGTQMIAKGKLLQEDLGIIQENMPVVAGAIEKAFGTNNVEKIRASGVTAQEFVQKVVGELGNLKRVEGGLSNSMDNLGQSVRSFFVSVGKEINEAFSEMAAEVAGDGAGVVA